MGHLGCVLQGFFQILYHVYGLQGRAGKQACRVQLFLIMVLYSTASRRAVESEAMQQVEADECMINTQNDFTLRPHFFTTVDLPFECD